MTTLTEYAEAAEFFEEMVRLGGSPRIRDMTALAATVLRQLVEGKVLVPREPIGWVHDYRIRDLKQGADFVPLCRQEPAQKSTPLYAAATQEKP